jgi:hypothetical protein
VRRRHVVSPTACSGWGASRCRSCRAPSIIALGIVIELTSRFARRRHKDRRTLNGHEVVFQPRDEIAERLPDEALRRGEMIRISPAERSER